eukprot:9095590-Alexandrium_andersonii.AAC.1
MTRRTASRTSGRRGKSAPWAAGPSPPPLLLVAVRPAPTRPLSHRATSAAPGLRSQRRSPPPRTIGWALRRSRPRLLTG